MLDWMFPSSWEKSWNYKYGKLGRCWIYFLAWIIFRMTFLQTLRNFRISNYFIPNINIESFPGRFSSKSYPGKFFRLRRKRNARELQNEVGHLTEERASLWLTWILSAHLRATAKYRGLALRSKLLHWQWTKKLETDFSVPLVFPLVYCQECVERFDYEHNVKIWIVGTLQILSPYIFLHIRVNDGCFCFSVFQFDLAVEQSITLGHDGVSVPCPPQRSWLSH